MSELNSAVLKALEVLDLLGQAPSGLRLKEIAFRLEQPESTTHRLLASLAAKGYVQQRDPAGPYTLGWKIVTLARALQAELRLAQSLRPYLERLVRQLQHTVNLAVLNNLRVMYLDCLVPNNAISLYTPPGVAVPAHATSLGKCLLAFLPEHERALVLDQLPLEPITPNTITSRDRLEAALAEIRRRGYALDHGEFVADVNCVAAPVLDASGHAVAAISVTARVAGLPERWEEEAAAALSAVARAAAQQLFVAPPAGPAAVVAPE